MDWQYEYAVLDNGMDDVSSFVDYFGNEKDIDLYNGLEGNDWQEQVYGRVGKTFSHDLSIRGGTKALNYSFSYAHFGVDAIMIGSDFVRDNASLKLNSSPNDKVKLSFSVRYSDTKISGGGANEQNEKSSSDSRLKHSVTYSPIPLVGLTDNGDEDVSSYLINPIIAVNDNDRKQYKKNFNMAGSFAWEIVKDLKFKTEFGIENYTYNDNRFYGKTTYYVKNTPTAENQGAPAVIMRDRKQAKLRSSNTLSYDLSKYLSDAHALTFLAGQEMISATKEQMESTVHGFPEGFVSDDAFNLTSQGVPYSTANVINPDDNLISFFSRVNYNYDGKYILTGTFRADGSSKFAEGNQWGYFPSAAVAWRLSDESFMDWSSNVLDDMKVRVSYGTAGNNNIPTGQLTQLFESKTTAYVNDVDNYWAPSKIMANPNLKWETTVTRNIGLDFSMFH
ncbi:MAG: TonB-dependent receptor, partial [Bacteroidales bacterium]|nr:TonB-dependent receptor [Bacteroidales bacterium]